MAARRLSASVWELAWVHPLLALVGGLIFFCVRRRKKFSTSS
ncbi:uncharacterized protein RCC_06700 [Ramularia collo-cygni]|uniref:Uncharacterized protein n=1 Tax=Ramularia collo-cygni TaxID=112498 RepID=A0A2D3UVU1_9PEZI|nr:uncharacterized protein RCC_06700 [Ramularia collo-cygni]CZT20841.1 uncharacterized protein RCC_06700 [Ramularia collo-cygni]